METPSPDLWSPARLIPVAGIRGQTEQEKRATSALLAVMGAVPDFGHALLAQMGAPKGRISTFSEIQLHDLDGNLSIPDGAVVIEKSQRRWRGLVEVKTGQEELRVEQVERYLSIAKHHHFDCLITISNEITPGVDYPPLKVDRRHAKGVPLFHLSWWRVITTAVMQHRYRGISDPDQAWILSELLAYLTHPNAGTQGLQDLGPAWTAVREAARMGTLRESDPEVKDVAARWDKFLDFMAMELSQDLGREVAPLRPRGHTHDEWLESLADELGRVGCLKGSLKIPDAVAHLDVEAHLRTRQLSTGVTVAAPREGRVLTRLNWILKQAAEAPFDLRLEVAFLGVRDTTSLLVREALEDPTRLFHPTSPKREPKSFTLTLVRPLGLKSGSRRGSFVRETRQQVAEFYGELVQNLKPWQPRAPRLSESRYTVEQHMTGVPEDLRTLFLAIDSYLNAFAEVERKSRQHYINYLTRGHSFTTIEIQPSKIEICLALDRSQVEVWDDGSMRDLSGVTHVGLGDVGFSLRSREQLPSIAALLRQAYEVVYLEEPSAATEESLEQAGGEEGLISAPIEGDSALLPAHLRV